MNPLQRFLAWLTGDSTQMLPVDPSPEATAGPDCAVGELGEYESDENLIEFEEEDEDEAELAELADESAPMRAGFVAASTSNPLAGFGRQLEKNGLKVRRVRGWRSRGRPGTFSPRGPMHHHTASNRTSGPAPALGICINGRSDLPGPLCQIHIARKTYVVSIIAAGRANHAGEGGPYHSVPKDSGNAYFYGIEVENDGKGEPWTKEMKETCATVFAVLLRREGRTKKWYLGHKTWAPQRKIDPYPLSIWRFRRRVARRMKTVKL